MDPTWKHPTTCLISGGTGVGKTYWVERFIINNKSMIQPDIQEVLFYYSEWQPAYSRLEKHGVKFMEGLPEIDSIRGDRRRLIVIDDLMDDINKDVSLLFTKISHHRNTSVMLLVQNLFGKNKEQRTISLNSKYIVVFKNPRDRSQIIHLARQAFPGQENYVRESYINATSEKHGYLLFDLTQNTPDAYRLRSKIFPTENQVVYMPKNTKT